MQGGAVQGFCGGLAWRGPLLGVRRRSQLCTTGNDCMRFFNRCMLARWRAFGASMPGSHALIEEGSG